MPPRPSGLATNQIYMAHFALTDGAAGEHRSFERFSRGTGQNADALAGATGEPAFAAWLEDWSVRQEADGSLRITAAADGGQTAVDLTLQPTRPPVLHGDAGLSQKGPEAGNASYYYSLVGLETVGTVTGLSWMDHEFGTSALSENAVGWDWFSLQLDNGAALMFAQIRTADGSRVDQFAGTLLFPDGSQVAVGADDFEVQPLNQWTSPRSGATYPAGWRVTLPAHDIDLTVEPLIQDQEMETSFIYWEGAVTAEGTLAGQPVAGEGYVELTGYSGQSSSYQR
jgi:predicted secreted hydrolase